jgi:hypothetical protein
MNDHGLGGDCPNAAVAQEAIDRWDIAQGFCPFFHMHSQD